MTALVPDYQDIRGVTVPIYTFHVGGVPLRCLIDTGATRNMIHRIKNPLYKRIGDSVTVGGYGSAMKLGYPSKDLLFDEGFSFNNPIGFSLSHFEVNAVLGLPFFRDNKIILDFAQNPLV